MNFVKNEGTHDEFHGDDWVVVVRLRWGYHERGPIYSGKPGELWKALQVQQRPSRRCRATLFIKTAHHCTRYWSSTLTFTLENFIYVRASSWATTTALQKKMLWSSWNQEFDNKPFLRLNIFVKLYFVCRSWRMKSRMIHHDSWGPNLREGMTKVAHPGDHPVVFHGK